MERVMRVQLKLKKINKKNHFKILGLIITSSGIEEKLKLSFSKIYLNLTRSIETFSFPDPVKEYFLKTKIN